MWNKPISATDRDAPCRLPTIKTVCGQMEDNVNVIVVQSGK
jgi:hypothetical protein